MRAYQKPVVMNHNEVSEGVYLASGDTENNGTVCESKYMRGVHQDPLTNGNPGHPAKDRGCEGCPADQGGACRLDLGPFGDPLMPRWEKQGKGPEDEYLWF